MSVMDGACLALMVTWLAQPPATAAPQAAATAQERASARADDLEKNALTLTGQRRFADAIAAAQEALAIREQLHGPDDAEVATTLHIVGVVQYRSGSFAAAEATFRRALRIWRATKDTSPQELSTALNDLGSALQQQGLLRDAEPLLLESLAVQQRANAPPKDLARAFNNVGGLLRDRGDLARARENFRKAEELWRSASPAGDPNIAIVLNNLGLVAQRMGQSGEAESYYRASLQLAEKDGETIALAHTLNNLASVIQEEGRLEEPEALYTRALALYEKLGAQESADAGQAMNNLAVLYLLKKDLPRAEPLYARALRIREAALGPNHPDVATALQSYAIFLQQSGRVDEALAVQSRATELIERHVASLLEVGSEAQKDSYLNLFRDSVDVSLWLRTLPGASVTGSRVALLTVLRRKGRIQEVLASSSGALRASGRAADGDLDALSRANAALARAVLQENVPPQQRETAIKELQGRIDDIESRVNAATARRENEPGVSIEAVQAAIPPDAVLLEFFRYRPFNSAATRIDERFGPARYTVCALRHTGDPEWVELGNADALDAAISAFRSAALNPRRRDVSDRARDIRPMLTDRLEALAGNARHVFVSPDGDLSLLPFQALVAANGRFLVEDRLFTYLSSGRELLHAGDTQRSGEPAVIIANPEFGPKAAAGGPVSRAFDSLPGADAEATAVRRLVPDARIIRGAEATEATLKSLHHPSVLHIATHGFFLAGDGPDVVTGTRGLRQVGGEPPTYIPPLLRSGLALAGANRAHAADEEDGILTASEAAMLDLHGTQLVFLSACESGLGVVNAGESVYGLRRAFAIAGARTQVLTLWQVSDTATKIFVTDFYRHLRAGEDGGTALRAAQRAALADPKRAHPFFWAAFIFSGQP